MAAEKKVRTCVNCGSKGQKGDLIRIVRTKDGEVFLDGSGKQAGRGAYLCSVACFESAVASKRIERALRTKVAPVDYERIVAEFTAMMREV